MNYANEQHRFGQVARQWNMIYPQGSEEWDAMLQELLDRDVILDPTMTVAFGIEVGHGAVMWSDPITLSPSNDF